MMRELKIVHTATEFEEWLSLAGPGERCCYYIGTSLADARTPYRRNKPACDRIDAIALMAWDAAQSQLVHLVQERSFVAPAQFIYIAERIRHPFAVKHTHAPGVPVVLPGIFRAA